MTTHPTTVALTQCSAYADGREVTLSGLYDVLEFNPTEPSAYVYSPCWTLVPHDAVDDEVTFCVDADVFESQVWPASYGRALAQERELDFYEQDREMAGIA